MLLWHTFWQLSLNNVSFLHMHIAHLQEQENHILVTKARKKKIAAGMWKYGNTFTKFWAHPNI